MKCVFCHRTHEQVAGFFIAGPVPGGPGICEDCLTACLSILKDARWRKETAGERYARLALEAARLWAERLGGRP